MSQARYVVGIDLGTTHCAVAYSPAGRADVRLMDIPQLVAPGEHAAQVLLPSFLYLPTPDELPEGHRALPWGSPDHLVGVLAQRRGAQVPNRLVASAKSWICHGGVNRRAPILPWSAPDGEPHISPYEASVRLLAHLRDAWDHQHPEAPMAQQEVVVTVPASFDEVARELTAQAATEAGLPEIRLLEEPQAAFYDFIGSNTEELPAVLGEANLVLVVDVGGGTTDLTLVRVHHSQAGERTLERVAVGGHLMLGGDNMDAALAHYVLKQAGIERKQDPTEWAALVQSARQAKERLLAEDAPEAARVSIRRRGRRLIGGTTTVTLNREAVRALLLDGFMPTTGPAEVADGRGRAGLTTLGLPYTTDPGIPRHVCAFLRRHERAAREAGARVIDGLPRPDLLLLNGGVFKAPALMDRLRAVLSGWFDGPPIALLAHTSLDTAVARGAARFALSKLGIGQTITGGSARAYYVGVEGTDGTHRAFCLAPKGMDEGTTVDVPQQRFELVLDRPVAFPLYGYTGDRADAAGELVAVDAELEALPPIQTVLRRQGDMWVNPKTGGVPVKLRTTLTEAGTLALFLVTVEVPQRRWRLEFDLQKITAEVAAPEPNPEPEEAKPEPLPKRFDEVRRAIERIFGTGRLAHDPRAAKGLRREVESVLGARGTWSSSVCRGVFDTLMTRMARRGSTPLHELNWLRLVSWGLRPGFGLQGDQDRVDRLWALHEEGLVHPKSKANWGEWWILWRRVAGGLDAARQAALFDDVRPWLGGGKRPQGPPAHGAPEMLRMLGALELLSTEAKVESGRWVHQRIKKLGSWWTLGRLGARAPFHGSAHNVVPPEVAAGWLDGLLALDWSSADGAAFAAVLITRMTGNSALDLDGARRAEVLRRLTALKASMSWITMVDQAIELSAGDARRVFGDSLPVGLRLA